MNLLQKVENKIYTPKVLEIGRIFFYIGLFFELIIFFLDRSDWQNIYQSQMFRVTFVFFVIKCLLTKYDKKQWLFIILTAIFTFINYRICYKDEIIRVMVFVIAMKDLDYKRVLKFNYIFTVIGVVLLGLLAMLGISGDFISVPGYGSKADAFMLSMGLGSSNTWGIQIWLLTALAVYLYHERIPKWFYELIAIIGVVVYGLTKCRIELLMMIFTALGGYILVSCKRFRESKIMYYLGVLATLGCIGFSVYAAKVSKWWEYQSDFQRKLDGYLTGRITSIYAFMNGGGVLANWKPFGNIIYNEYFDMGWVRLFWWYGYIPGILVVISIFIIFAYQYKIRDYMGFLLVISIVIFTVLEAHFVSQFIARNYYLFIAGGAWYKIIHDKQSDKDSQKHISFYIGSLSKGGAERVFCNLAEYFLSIGWRVTMITQYIKEDEYDLPAGADRVISDLTEDETGGRVYNLFARILKLHRIIRDTDSDILMTTIGKANFMSIICAAFTRTRVVVSVVADPAEEYPTRIMRFLLQTLFGDADGIIMQTTDQQRFLRPALRRVSVILPNSVSPNFNLDRFDGTRKKNIYMVGRMDENKNQAMSIKAFAEVSHKYPDARLILIGDGDKREELQNLTYTLGLSDRVEFTGIIGNVAEVIHEGYAFVLTSNTEGMPNTLLEAMSLGLACISTDCPCGGPKDMIQNGINGMLVKVGDVDDLTKAFDTILNDYDLMDQMGRNAYAQMQAYKPEIVNARWRDYYLHIINQ